MSLSIFADMIFAAEDLFGIEFQANFILCNEKVFNTKLKANCVQELM